jgi:hypothetical protein
MKIALAGTCIRHYHGIDVSKPALDLAARNLDAMPFEVDLDHRDFVEAMPGRPEPAHAAWCSLSIHHLSIDDKRRLMTAIPGAVGARHLPRLWRARRRVFACDARSPQRSARQRRSRTSLQPARRRVRELYSVLQLVVHERHV